MLKRAAHLAVLGAILGFYLWNPWVAFPCPVRAALHLPCPGCGMTRALGEFAHGHFAAATALHPLVWIVMPLAALAMTIECVSYVRTGEFARLSRIRTARAVAATTFALLVIVWIARFFGALGGPAPA